MPLITYEQAVHHLKQEGVLDISPEDPDLALKVDHAIAIVTLATKLPWLAPLSVPPVGTPPSVNPLIVVPDPQLPVIQAMTLRVLSWLYRNRGDDEPTKDMSVEQVLISSGVYLVRVPTLA